MFVGLFTGLTSSPDDRGISKDITCTERGSERAGKVDVKITNSCELKQLTSILRIERLNIHGSLRDDMNKHGSPHDTTQQHGSPNDITQQHGSPHDITQQHGSPNDITQQHGSPHDITQQVGQIVFTMTNIIVKFS